MSIFKWGQILFPTSVVMALSTQIIETKALDNIISLVVTATAAVAVKIMYDRYQHINILGSLTTNPKVTYFSNNTASLSATSMLLGFLVYIFMFYFKVDSYGLVANNIFICTFATLYMWMQGIVTIYGTSLFYDQQLLTLRQNLSSFSSVVIFVMAIFGTTTTFFHTGGLKVGNGIYKFCVSIIYVCSYVIATLYCIYLLSFEKDYKFFTEGKKMEDWCDENIAQESTPSLARNHLTEVQNPFSHTNSVNIFQSLLASS